MTQVPVTRTAGLDNPKTTLDDDKRMTVVLIPENLRPTSLQTLALVATRLQREVPLVLITRGQWAPTAQAALIVVNLPSELRSGKKAGEIALRLVENIRRLLSSEGPPVYGVILASMSSRASEDDSSPGMEWLTEEISVPIWKVDVHSPRLPLPEELHHFLGKMEAVRDLNDLIALPTYIEAAQGYDAAVAFANRGIARLRGDGDNFVAEAIAVLGLAHSIWGYEAAIAWLRSSNAFLGGARPIQILALHGPERVVESLDAVSQLVYA